jgi:polynucleotide 5'-hydroxyl-kinase GRC3/NOL9
MEKRAETDTTFIIPGPAAVKLVAGEASIFEAKLIADTKVIVRKGRRLPIEVKSGTIIEITSEDPIEIVEISGSTIPLSWRNAANEALSCAKQCKVVILGSTDCGKTSFCTFLANVAIQHGRKVAIIDADIGQSDIGPPTTMGLGLITKPIFDPFLVEAKEIFFVGSTNPRHVEESIYEGILYLIKKSEELNVDFLVINTDGWVQDEEAKQYKICLLKKIYPSIICVQSDEELKPILSAFDVLAFRILCLNVPSIIRKRTKNERKELREQGYRKYLKEGSIRVLSLKETSIVNVQASRFFKTETLNILETILESKLLFVEEYGDYLLLVLTDHNEIIEEKVKMIENSIGKPVRITNGKGLLAALFDDNGVFLGLAVVQSIDIAQQKIKIYTPYKGKISFIKLGRIKVTNQGSELGLAL